MDEIKVSPNEFFSSPDSVKTTINGIPARVRQLSDEYGNFFAIEAISKEVSDICGQFLFEKYIIRIDYMKYHGHVAVIKAYF